jgi:trans-aconitate 2-methyltransferase
MKPAKDWNPDLYLKYNNERIQPSIDLVSHIDIENPSKIIDIGCGPGNSTQILVRRFPEAQITGLDSSPAMIEKAKTDYPDMEWLLADAGKDEIPGKYDIVFSNATIQWIPDHKKLIKKFHSLLNEGGLIAIQLPLFNEMQISEAIKRTADNRGWNNLFSGTYNIFTLHDHSFYYDILSELFSSVRIWESNYIHILESHTSILEMMTGTGLRPYLDKLENDNDKKEFEKLVLEEIKKVYPQQKDGKVLLTFKRLFFIAGK